MAFTITMLLGLPITTAIHGVIAGTEKVYITTALHEMHTVQIIVEKHDQQLHREIFREPIVSPLHEINQIL